MQERARELLPQVLLTLLSLIQAIALEGLWSRIGGEQSPHLYAGGTTALAGWLQVSAVVLGILLVWLIYTSMVIRFRWVPTTRDSIFPFAIGLLEFAVIEVLGPEHSIVWTCLMTAVYLLVTWASNDIFVRAARERGEQGAAWTESREFMYSVGAIVVQGLLVAGLALAGGYGGFAVFVFGVINLLLLFQMRRVHLRSPDATAAQAE